MALYLGDAARAEHLIQWAGDALVAGWDSPSLRILAGLEPEPQSSISDALPYWKRAVAELGLAVPTPDVALRGYVDELAAEIVDRRSQPRDVVAEIHDVAVGPLFHPPDLQPWCDLCDGLDPELRAPVEDDQLDERIIAYATHWLNARGGISDGAA